MGPGFGSGSHILERLTFGGRTDPSTPPTSTLCPTIRGKSGPAADPFKSSGRSLTDFDLLAGSPSHTTGLYMGKEAVDAALPHHTVCLPANLSKLFVDGLIQEASVEARVSRR